MTTIVVFALSIFQLNTIDADTSMLFKFKDTRVKFAQEVCLQMVFKPS